MKKVIIVLLIFLSFTSVFARTSSNQVSSFQINQHIKELTKPSTQGRETGTEGNRLAAGYIVKHFKEIGLNYHSLIGSYYQLFPIKKNSVTIQGRNIVGILDAPAKKNNNSFIVIGAHYDHLGASEKIRFEGANDNASGVAAVLELARMLFKKTPFNYSVIFVAFDAEESGRLGSKHFVRFLKKNRVNVRLMINLEMIGKNPPNEIHLIYEHLSESIKKTIKSVSKQEEIKLTYQKPGDDNLSDYISFQSAGFPALCLFGGSDIDYSSPRDTAEKLNINKITIVTHLTLQVLHQLNCKTANNQPQ